jgi:hypothetical protein
MAISSKRTSGPRRRESGLAHNFRCGSNSKLLGMAAHPSVPIEGQIRSEFNDCRISARPRS